MSNTAHSTATALSVEWLAWCRSGNSLQRLRWSKSWSATKRSSVFDNIGMMEIDRSHLVSAGSKLAFFRCGCDLCQLEDFRKSAIGPTSRTSKKCSKSTFSWLCFNEYWTTNPQSCANYRRDLQTDKKKLLPNPYIIRSLPLYVAGNFCSSVSLISFAGTRMSTSWIRVSFCRLWLFDLKIRQRVTLIVKTCALWTFYTPFYAWI